MYVASVIPTGFAAYARIFHPARDLRDDVPVRWTEAALRHGRTPHSEMQWEAIAAGTEKERLYDPPEPGRLPPEEAHVLVERLRPFTAQPEAITFAIWDGWGGWNPGSWAALVSAETAGWGSGAEAARTQGALPPGWPPADAALFHLPDARHRWRTYRLYRGPLTAAVDLAERGPAPSLWWPLNRSWCVATEVDFGWTYVGGAEPLVQAILADRRLEAYPAWPGHRADVEGDRINGQRH